MADYHALLEEIDLPQKSRRGSLEHVLALVDPLPRGRALDVPSGPGLLTEALRLLGFSVTGADIDSEQFGLHDSIPFRTLDLDEPLPFPDGCFDLIHCGDGIEHIENPFALFREFSRILDERGTLIVATPNYLNLERKLRFLLTGSLTKPLKRPSGSGQQSRPTKADRGHINPLTLTRMAYIAETEGLQLEHAETLLPKARQNFLAPLALLLWAYGRFLSRSRRHDLFAEQTLPLSMLLGGKKLLAVFSKSGSVPRS